MICIDCSSSQLQEQDPCQPQREYYRLFQYVPDSITHDKCTSISIAFEAARKFGEFTHYMEGFLTSHHLHCIIEDFHDLDARYRQYEDALAHYNRGDNRASLHECSEVIDLIDTHRFIVDIYHREIKQSNGFRLRVTHHDTKISNVLFDEQQRGT